MAAHDPDALLRLVEDRTGDVSLERRIEAAERLGADDPRIADDALDGAVEIPGGSFVMGVAAGDGHRLDESPVREVLLDPFWIDRFPVTVHAYARFVADRAYARPEIWSAAGWRWRCEGSHSRSERLDVPVSRPRFWGDEAWARFGSPSRPIVGVSWFEADAFARWRGKRLPTEAQWEKAARSADGRRYPWGDGWLADVAAHREHGPRATVPVGIFARGESPFGVRDVVGSVWQWCADWYGEYDPREIANPCGPDDGTLKVARGGAWNTLRDSLRTTNRNAFPPHARFSNLGFRCVRVP